MSFEIVSNSIYGFLVGGGVVYDYESGKNIRQGQTDFLAVKQSARIGNIINFGIYIYQQVNDQEIFTSSTKRKWCVRLLSYPIPFALQIINHRVDGKSHPILKQSIIAMRNNLENVALAVDLLLTGYFATMVSPVFGVGLLAGFTVEILKDQKLLSPKIKEIWEKAHLCIVFAHIVTLPLMFPDFSYFDLADIVLNISIFIWEHYFQKPLSDGLVNIPMTLEEAKAILEKPIGQFRVNLEHLAKSAKHSPSEAREVDIEKTMETLIPKVIWTNDNLITFKTKLLSDNRFQSEYPLITSVEEIDDPFAIEEFEKGARLMAFEIANRCIAHGDSYIRYDVLQRNLKAILKQLDKIDNCTEDLFKLAIEGGAYCASGKVKVIQEMFESNVLRYASLNQKFLLWLQLMREEWFTQIYATLSQYAYRLPKGIVDPSDIHFYNSSLFYFDTPFKLHDETIKNDMSINESGLCNYSYRFILSLILDIIAWPYMAKSPNWYSAEALVQGIAEASLSASTSGKKESEFWQEWIDQLPESKEKKTLDDELLEFKLFGEAIHTESRQGLMLNPKLIKLMLYRMGILENIS